MENIEHLAKRAKYKIIQNYIVNHRAGSLATSTLDGKPHVAIIYTIVKSDLSIYFSSRVESRKYINILQNPMVAIAYGDEVKTSTVQLCGVAKRVDNLREEQKILNDLFLIRFGEKNWPLPPAKLFERGFTNELAIIKIKPIEMTFANFETLARGRYRPFFTKII